MTWDGTERRQSGVDTARLLGQLEGKVESMERAFTEHAEREEKMLSDLYDKVNGLSIQQERAASDKWKLLAAVGAAGSGMGAVVSKLLEKL